MEPEHATFMAAASSADWNVPSFAADILNAAGPQSRPIVAPTFLLLPTNPMDAARRVNLRRFFDWAFKDGDAMARERGSIPLPEATGNAVRAAWNRQFGARVPTGVRHTAGPHAFPPDGQMP